MRITNRKATSMKISIGNLKTIPIGVLERNDVSKRNRDARGTELVSQLLKCYNIDDAIFDLNNFKIKHAARPLRDKDRLDPVFMISFNEKAHKCRELSDNDYFEGDNKDIYLEYRKLWHNRNIVRYTTAKMKMTVIIPIQGCKCDDRITITTSCRIPRVGIVYNWLIMKLLYIYACSVITDTSKYTICVDTDLVTPFGDIYRDSINHIKCKYA
jgi:hypothetical protein